MNASSTVSYEFLDPSAKLMSSSSGRLIAISEDNSESFVVTITFIPWLA